MTALRVDLGDGPLDGAHRLVLRGSGPAALYDRAAERVMRHLDATRRLSGWLPMTRLECVGWESRDGEALLWLVGSLENWLGLHSAQVGIPHLQAAEEIVGDGGGLLLEATVERRHLRPPDHEMIVGGEWPFRLLGVHRGSVVTPGGDVSGAQRRGLAQLLRDSILREQRVETTAVVDGEAIRLGAVIDAAQVAEVVEVWRQVWWVDLDGVTLADAAPRDVIARLSGLDWEPRPEGTRTAIPEVQEFLRRLVAAADALGIHEWPVFDLAAAPTSDDHGLDAILASRPLPAFTRSALTGMLRWYTAPPADVSDPWEPLLRAFEAVGPIGENELGELQVGVASVPWRDRDRHTA